MECWLWWGCWWWQLWWRIVMQPLNQSLWKVWIKMNCQERWWMKKLECALESLKSALPTMIAWMIAFASPMAFAVETSLRYIPKSILSFAVCVCVFSFLLFYFYGNKVCNFDHSNLWIMCIINLCNTHQGIITCKLLINFSVYMMPLIPFNALKVTSYIYIIYGLYILHC